MATQNLFEKYGIKEVADVTFYRIEKKEETYESQREISVASILKGAVELRTVYPLENGKGIDEGFEAYVFTDADVLTGANYDCDDIVNLKATIKGTFTTDTELTTTSNVSVSYNTIVATASDYTVDSDYPVYLNTDTNRYVESSYLQEQDYSGYELAEKNFKINYFAKKENENGSFTYHYSGKTDTFQAKITDELSYGYIDENNDNLYEDPDKYPGTHEFTYAEQAFMLFAKRQNLITKTGTRYRFYNPDSFMGNLIFEDRYTTGPQATEKVVVLGVATGNSTDDASWSEATYDTEEVDKALLELKQKYEAKAYEVVYSEYAELVVEDEMGYFDPFLLGKNYNKNTNSIVPFLTPAQTTYTSVGDSYTTWARNNGKKVDSAIARAKMWGDAQHFSINDAIDALRQQQKIIDTGDSQGLAGIKNLFGGYKVSHQIGTNYAITEAGKDDTENGAKYTYRIGKNTTLTGDSTDKTSNYPLKDVLETIAELASIDEAAGQDIRVDYQTKNKDTGADQTSNRAIYVRNATANVSASAYIYLLHNKAYKRLITDEEGVFTFDDKAGNKLYYQDKIFAGIEWLALVIVGDQGMIFVVNRHGTKDVSRIAWMVNDNGYITNSKAKVLVNNGLIHTTDITVNDETFEATCAVKNLKIRKITKRTNHYVPVLFLDTLKISTLEQTAEEVYATGGKGNANLVGWDFNKEITLSLQDALFTPASMSAIFGNEGTNFVNGVKEAKQIDRFEKVTAKRSFIVPAGNMNGTPTEADKTAQAVFYDPNTMQPYPDGTPIAEGEIFYKFTRSIAYEGQSIGHVIEISADKFPGTYKIVGDTYVRSKETGEDERFQFVINQAKMTSEQTITLEADGEPSVFDMNMTVLRPDDGIMVRFVQYNVVENEEENDGSTMIKGTENLNLLDDAELFKVSADSVDEEEYIGATEY